MQEVTDYLFDHDVLNIRRRELLHLKWTDCVYDPIQRHILAETSGKDFENLLLHKRLLYNEFLAKSNRKVLIMVFLKLLNRHHQYSCCTFINIVILLHNHICLGYSRVAFINDHISKGGNAIASVHLSVHLFVSTLSLEPTDH